MLKAWEVSKTVFGLVAMIIAAAYIGVVLAQLL